MADKKFKLSSGKDVVLLEMSVDDIDFCNDVTQIVLTLKEIKSLKIWLKQELLGFVRV